jgi:large subunit ribosomal protein L10
VAKREDKEQKYGNYTESLQKAKVAVVAEYRGLSVAQLSALRADLFKQDACFTVVKNTLMKRAIKGTDGAALEPLFEGPMAVLFGFGDEVPPVKTLKDFLNKSKIGEIKGGYIGSQLLSKQEALALADLPSLDELRAKLLGVINSPLVGIVGAISSQQRGLVNVLDQYSKTLETA